MGREIKNRVLLLSMGCSKNLVDTEHLAYQLNLRGYLCFFDGIDNEPDIVVVNTCGFINDAKEESIGEILFWGKKRSEGKIQHLFVMGCLSGLYKGIFPDIIPEVDAWFGKFDYMGIIDALPSLILQIECCNQPFWKREISTASHTAYLKISEGCNRRCSFCSIPLMVGKLQSRPEDEILAEVRWLVNQGVKEFNVVAQDICSYGADRGQEQYLPQLISHIAHIEDVEWLRLHYAYPTNFPLDLLQVMQENRNICRYLDIPFQHCSDRLLKSMRRGISAAEQDALIANIREKLPDIVLRTTLLVGYPSETESDFEELLQWVSKMQFEHLGAFMYSHEEGTYAYRHYADDVPQDVKLQRLDRLMEVQASISDRFSRGHIGQVLKVIIDKREGDYYVGRTEWDSPEVDNEVLIKAVKGIQIGEFYKVRITNVESFDLYGEIVF